MRTPNELLGAERHTYALTIVYPFRTLGLEYLFCIFYPDAYISVLHKVFSEHGKHNSYTKKIISLYNGHHREMKMCKTDVSY